jgi:hypothetical protein
LYKINTKKTPETLKLLEKSRRNASKYHNDFLNRTVGAQEIMARIDR